MNTAILKAGGIDVHGILTDEACFEHCYNSTIIASTFSYTNEQLNAVSADNGMINCIIKKADGSGLYFDGLISSCGWDKELNIITLNIISSGEITHIPSFKKQSLKARLFNWLFRIKKRGQYEST